MSEDILRLIREKYYEVVNENKIPFPRKLFLGRREWAAFLWREKKNAYIMGDYSLLPVLRDASPYEDYPIFYKRKTKVYKTNQPSMVLFTW